MKRRKSKKGTPAGSSRTGLKRKGLTAKAKPITILSSYRLGKNANGNLSTVYERLKVREEWLREEMRANRTILLNLQKWGVTVLIGIESSLYFLRRDVANHMAQIGTLPENGTIPLTRWLVGTVFLVMIAFIFCKLTKYILKRHLAYRIQLNEMSPSFSGIKEGSTGGAVNRLHLFLFYAFPLFDLILYFYFRATSHVTLTW